jgi:hypothetical protein
MNFHGAEIGMAKLGKATVLPVPVDKLAPILPLMSLRVRRRSFALTASAD